MLQGRGTVTDRLANVIQVIQLGRKTGALVVERDNGTGVQEGKIIFVRGQITHAQGGALYSQQALTWLCTWETCRFVFTSSRIEQTTDQLQALAPPREDTARQQSAYALVPVTPSIENVAARQQERASPLSIPRRTVMAEEALQQLEQVGFSRLHRRLLLLIDGHRTTAELRILMGRRTMEIQKLLLDLERIGLIQALS
jgi:hypothetical protein